MKTKKPKPPAVVSVARDGTRARVSIPKEYDAVNLTPNGCMQLAVNLMRIAAEIRVREEKQKAKTVNG